MGPGHGRRVEGCTETEKAIPTNTYYQYDRISVIFFITAIPEQGYKYINLTTQ